MAKIINTSNKRRIISFLRLDKKWHFIKHETKPMFFKHKDEFTILIDDQEIPVDSETWSDVVGRLDPVMYNYRHKK